MSNVQNSTTLFPSQAADLPSPAASIPETDAGPLPPPYAMPSPPMTPPAPRMPPASPNSIHLTISHPVSISGSHNDINISIPLESTLKNVLSSMSNTNSHSSRQTAAGGPMKTSVPCGVQVMLHCPISIVGDCNTVSIESESSGDSLNAAAAELSGLVYVPMPMMVGPNRSNPPHHVSSSRPHHQQPTTAANASSTSSRSLPAQPSQPQQLQSQTCHTQPSTAIIPQLSTPMASPQMNAESKKRNTPSAGSSVPSIDMAPFTKRQKVEDTSADHETDIEKTENEVSD